MEPILPDPLADQRCRPCKRGDHYACRGADRSWPQWCECAEEFFMGWMTPGDAAWR